jgi:hypothetical protein
MKRRNEAGDTLVEICIALVIMGAVVGAYFAASATASTASKTSRDLATADTVLRDYAEAAKTAVRSSCTTSGASYTVSYTPPTGFTVNDLGSQSCPSVTQTESLQLTVTLPNGTTKSLSLDVRSP